MTQIDCSCNSRFSTSSPSFEWIYAPTQFTIRNVWHKTTKHLKFSLTITIFYEGSCNLLMKNWVNNKLINVNDFIWPFRFGFEIFFVYHEFVFKSSQPLNRKFNLNMLKLYKSLKILHANIPVRFQKLNFKFCASD